MRTATTKEQIVEELLRLGVTVEEPETPKEESFARALEAFAQFALLEQPEQTQALLEQYLSSSPNNNNNDDSVGVLQGGNDEHSIYRVSIQQRQEEEAEEPQPQKPQSSAKQGAAEALMEAFSVKYPQISLTVEKLQQYMLTMCNKRSEKRQWCDDDNEDPLTKKTVIEDRTYHRLGNLMFILSFGPVHGQVRHIDHMNPNLQICLYMSNHCPSTIIYATEKDDDDDDPTGTSIDSCLDLLHHWEATTTGCSSGERAHVPFPIQTLLTTMGDVVLSTKPYAKYFSKAWQTLNAHLANFGRLYQPVSHSLFLQECDPGTTLIAGGANHVHAGPPAKGPRMFAFAIGIPEEPTNDSCKTTSGGNNEDDHAVHRHKKETAVDDLVHEENDGEVQYSPALLHIDLCCILFGMLDFEEPDHQGSLQVDAGEMAASSSMIHHSKRFLLDLLLPFLQEYPRETYSIHFGEDRQLLREWLEELVPAQREGNMRRVETLLETAVMSDALMYSPDVATKSFRKHQQRQQRRNQRKVKQQTQKKNKELRI